MRGIDHFIEHHHARIPADLARSIRSEYEDSSDWVVAKTWGSLEDFRICSRIPLSSSMTIRDSETRGGIDSGLFRVFNLVMKEYITKYGTLSLNSDSGYDLLRYDPGGKYEYHIDESYNEKRIVSVISCLSEQSEYEGGELEFLEGPTYKLDFGDILVFPSNFVYRHRVRPVESGRRYSIVTWFS